MKERPTTGRALAASFLHDRRCPRLQESFGDRDPTLNEAAVRLEAEAHAIQVVRDEPDLNIKVTIEINDIEPPAPISRLASQSSLHPD
jgi:hypothetical protein